MATIVDFSGGILQNFSSDRIPPNYATILDNCTIERGPIESLNERALYATDVGPYFTKFYDKLVSYGTEAHFLEWENLLLICDPTTYPVKLGNNFNIIDANLEYTFSPDTLGAITKIGDEAPSSVDNYGALTDIGDSMNLSENFNFGVVTFYQDESNLEIDLASSDRLGIVASTTAPSVTLAAGAMEGTYRYGYTYYSSTDGTESAMSPLKLAQPVTQQVTVDGFVASTDPQVTNIKVYRIGEDYTDFILLGTVANSAASSVVDNSNLKDDVEYASTQGRNPAPDYLKYLTRFSGGFWGAVGTKVYFSEAGNPNYWGFGLNFLEFGETITGLTAVLNGLLVFTKYETYLITGNTANSYAKYLADNTQGCVDYKSIQNSAGTAIWYSNDGICTSNGSGVKLISWKALGKYSVTVRGSAFYDNKYYLSSNKEVLVVDYNGDKPAILTMSYNPVLNINSPYGVVTAYNGIKPNNTTEGVVSKITDDTTVYPMEPTTEGALTGITYGYSIGPLQVLDDELYYYDSREIYKAFGDTERKTNLEYKSGYIHDGDYLNLKEYDKFRFKYNGAFSIEVYVNNEAGQDILAFSFSDESNYDKTKLIRMPEQYKKAYSFQIRVSGIGSFIGYSYTLKGQDVI